MNPGLRASASGMKAQQLRVDTIANNLANVNTTGFKRGRASFEDMLYETLQGTRIVNYEGAATTAPVQIGRGVRLADIMRIHNQGSIESTQRPLDLAIEGEGFFQIQMPDGTTAYTRDGTFSISDNGTIVNHNGHALFPQITVPQDAVEISISPVGIVSATVGTSGNRVELGHIELARFVNPSGLQSLGGNLLAETPASGEAMVGNPQEDGFGQIVQGALESSNVEIVQEMVDMITAQRAYEVNSKAIKASEEMIQIVTNELLR